MTYEGLFEKCKTLKELNLAHRKYLDEAPNSIAILEIAQAYRKRREEIRSQYRERCYG